VAKLDEPVKRDASINSIPLKSHGVTLKRGLISAPLLLRAAAFTRDLTTLKAMHSEGPLKPDDCPFHNGQKRET